MWALVIVLGVWMTYVEVEMPERTNECPFNVFACEEEVEEVEEVEE